MPNTNFLLPAANNPIRSSQAEFSYYPAAVVFEDDKPDKLQDKINDFVADVIARPPTGDQYYIRNMSHSSANKDKKKISYSVVVHYEVWTQN